MNWDAVGALGEVLGAAAVVATLGYLATQIRHSTNREKMAQEFVSNEYFNELRMLVASDAELAEIEVRGMQDLSLLSDLERRRFDELVTSWVWAIQKFYRQDMADQVHTNFPQTALAFFRRRSQGGEGFIQWWSELRVEYSDQEFRDAMDEIVDKLDAE